MALLDVRGSTFRRRTMTSTTPATQSGDYVDHIYAVAAATVDLPALIADPAARFNGYTLPQWLALLADGDDPTATWVRTSLAKIGYRHPTDRRQTR